MPLVNPTMKLSEVVEEHTSLIPVITRFGIRLGLGDKSVTQICDEYGIDTDFFLIMVNTFLNEEYFPQKKLQMFHTSQIIISPMLYLLAIPIFCYQGQLSFPSLVQSIQYLSLFSRQYQSH